MSFICPKCSLEPNSHSFNKVIIPEYENINVYYCCPSKAKYFDDNEGILLHYDGMLKDNGDYPWIWIFDCDNFSLKHALNIKLAKDLAILISNKYSHNLNKIIIINPTWYINYTLYFITPFLNDKIKNLIFINRD